MKNAKKYLVYLLIAIIIVLGWMYLFERDNTRYYKRAFESLKQDYNKVLVKCFGYSEEEWR